MQVDILPPQQDKNWKKTLYSCIPFNREIETSGHGWRSLLYFMPGYYSSNIYEMNEPVALHTGA